MIERDFIVQKTKELYIKKHIENQLKGVGISSIRLKKIPLGEKIIIHSSRPSLIVGSKGSNIKDLTRQLKKKFKLENPQIEINEVKNIFLDAHIVADRIASSLERFGSTRFKSVGYKIMQNVLNSGALGVEIILSGKIPGSRARNWRFYQGYLKKCGDIAFSGVLRSKRSALLKSGIIGIKVAIMPPDLTLPDHIEILAEPINITEEVVEEPKKVRKPRKKKTKAKPAEKNEKSTEEKIDETQVSEDAPAEEPKKEEVKEETPEEAAPKSSKETPKVKEEKTEEAEEAPSVEENPVIEDTE